MNHKRTLWIRFCRFSAVGILNTFLHLSFFSSFYSLGMHYLLSQTLAFILVNIITFWINRTWTFGSVNPAVGEQLILYYLTRSSTLGVTLVQTLLLVELLHLSPYIGQLTAVAINVGLNFLFSQVFVFNPVQKSIEHYLYLSYINMGCLNGKDITVYYIIPLFNEHHRLYPPSADNPHGEDFLQVKVEQLESLHANTPEFKWRMIFIDDGDQRNHSGCLVQERIQKLYPEKAESGQMCVWYLEELAPEIAAISRKGGAVITAMRHLVSNEMRPTDVLIYTDADVSSDLRLSGSLIAPLLREADICLSSRWHDGATVVNRGIKQKISSWIYNLLVLMLLGLDFSDTQNGFKAFRMESVRLILPYLRETGFSFDTEILMVAQLFGQKIEEIPIFWKDSKAESNVSMLIDPLKAIGGLIRQRIYRRHIARNNSTYDYIGLGEQ